jgi:glycosyltransferase involved in cell wall biosynthesis
MKILHLTYSLRGGAGTAALRQHKALRAAGIDSTVFSLQSSNKEYERLLRKHNRRKLIQNFRTRAYGITPELFSDHRSVWNIENHPLVKSADVIHLHWVAGMIDLEEFFSSITKPVVWTLHDAWAFTGGFHYEKYWASENFTKRSARGLEIRRSIFSTARLQLIFPSRYLQNLCLVSGVFKKSEFHQIDNCIDDLYYRHEPENNKYEARNRIEILYASGELGYYRKGFDIIQSAIDKKCFDSSRIVILGKTDKSEQENAEGIEYRMYERDAEAVLQYYTKSDVLIHTSREDNQPNVIAESLCCGTPVIATPAGGVPEMITNNVNGVLLESFRPEAVCESIRSFDIRQYERKRIAKEARERFSPERFSTAIRRIYSGL